MDPTEDNDRDPDTFPAPKTRAQRDVAWFFYLTFGALMLIAVVDDSPFDTAWVTRSK